MVSTTDASTQTNIDGSYAIALYPGVYDITFSKTNYQTITIKNVVVDVGKVTELNEYLTTPGGTLNFVSTSSSFPPGETGVLYDTRVRISGGVYPYVFTKVTGSLPHGLLLDPAYGNISGTPTTPGSYAFAIGVTDSTKAYAERDFIIEVTEELRITTASPLARGTVGVSYFQSFQASGGDQPFTFTQSGGSLPSGLSLSSSGSLSGTPSSSGAFDFTLTVRDDSGRTADKSFHLEVVNALSISNNQPANGIVGTPYNLTLTASGGFGAYRWSLSRPKVCHLPMAFYLAPRLKLPTAPWSLP